MSKEVRRDWNRMAKEKLAEIPFGKFRSLAEISLCRAYYSQWSLSALIAVAKYVIPFAKQYWGQEWSVQQAVLQVQYGQYPHEARTPRLVRFFESWKDYQGYCYYREAYRLSELVKEPPQESKFVGIEPMQMRDDWFGDSWWIGIDKAKGFDKMFIGGEGELTKALRETEEMLGIRPSGLSILKDSFGYPNGRNGARLKVDDYE